MYSYGANWTGTDISEEQIKYAKQLSENMNINYQECATEDISFPSNSFDVITACQCFWYFKHEQVAPKFYDMLKSKGTLLVLYMAWLPYEDKIAGESEKLILKYSPNWSGAGKQIHPISIPECYNEFFELVHHDEYYLNVPFTKETWNGRMKACRGVGASLTAGEIDLWEQEHIKLLDEIAPEEFDVLHYGAMAELRVRK
jgi:cyclopropane fatty-acyl-phospholipid synthase-like methyltransferase